MVPAGRFVVSAQGPVRIAEVENYATYRVHNEGPTAIRVLTVYPGNEHAPPSHIDLASGCSVDVTTANGTLEVVAKGDAKGWFAMLLGIRGVAPA